MPLNITPGEAVVSLGRGDVQIEVYAREVNGVSVAAAMVFTPEDSPHPWVSVVIPDVATAFALMQQLRNIVYELGGVDPVMEACDEVEEYRGFPADWKDAHGRLTRRCAEALNTLDPRRRVIPPKQEDE